jgi:uncharacterized membrane protein
MSENGDSDVSAHETIDERLLLRVIFFTDAVFAIVLTLMVLDLRPPSADHPLSDPSALQELWNHFFALAMSFLVIGIFWIAHLTTTRRMNRFDWPSAVANLAFLFPVCLLPFATAWWGSGMGSALAWQVYCGVMVVTSFANLVLVLVSTRGGGRLMAGGVTGAERLYRVARAASPGISFALGLAATAAGQLRLAQFCWVLIPILMLICGRFLKPRAAVPV